MSVTRGEAAGAGPVPRSREALGIAGGMEGSAGEVNGGRAGGLYGTSTCSGQELGERGGRLRPPTRDGTRQERFRLHRASALGSSSQGRQQIRTTGHKHVHFLQTEPPRCPTPRRWRLGDPNAGTLRVLAVSPHRSPAGKSPAPRGVAMRTLTR